MSDSRVRLAAFLAWKGWSQGGLAAACDVHQTTVSKLLEGRRGAGLGLALAIERVTAEWPEGPILAREWIESHLPIVTEEAPEKECA